KGGTTISATMTSGRPAGGLLTGSARWTVPLAVVLAGATLVQYGPSANGVCWAAVQVVLVGLAAYDFETRRIPNVVTVPGALAAIGLRAAFERSALAEVLVAGAASFAAFFVLALLVRGGFGMGDVKLAAMLGFLLGAAVLPGFLV